jgi:hypothetical protein
VAVAAPRLADALRSGLDLTVGCSEACSVSALAFRGSVRGPVVGRVRGNAPAPGPARLTLRIDRTRAAALRRLASVPLVVDLRVADGAGNGRRLTRRVTLRR